MNLENKFLQQIVENANARVKEPTLEEFREKWFKRGFYGRFSNRTSKEWPKEKYSGDGMMSDNTPVGHYGWNFGEKFWQDEFEKMFDKEKFPNGTVTVPFSGKDYLHIFRLKAGAKLLDLGERSDNIITKKMIYEVIEPFVMKWVRARIDAKDRIPYTRILEVIDTLSKNNWHGAGAVPVLTVINDFGGIIPHYKNYIKDQNPEMKAKELNKKILELAWEYVDNDTWGGSKAVTKSGVPLEDIAAFSRMGPLIAAVRLTEEVFGASDSISVQEMFTIFRKLQRAGYYVRGMEFGITKALLELGIDAVVDRVGETKFVIFNNFEAGQIAVLNPKAIEYVAIYRNPNNRKPTAP